MFANIVSRFVGNYNLSKYWQLGFSEMLAMHSLEMLATNVRNLSFRKWRRVLTIICSEMLTITFVIETLTTHVNTYNFQQCRR